MNLSDINWDVNAIGSWPQSVKSVAVVLIAFIVLIAGFFFDTSERLNALEGAENKEQELKRSLESKQKKAVNLEDYQDQLAQIEVQLYEMIRQMPTKEEVASLLTDISQTGLASGLEFRLFKPGSAIQKDFYSELPISIEVIGRYDELGTFISGVASLPRIVTIHDVNIMPEKKPTKDTKPGALVMTAIIKTYNESEVEASPSKSPVKKPKGTK